MGKVKNITSSELKVYEATDKMEVAGHVLSGEDLFVYREPLEGSSALSNRWITIDIDTHLTQELINEGLAREVINRIQKSRKDLNFNVEDRIQIKFKTSDTLSKVILGFSDYIKKETLTTSIESSTELKSSLEYQIESETLFLEITK